MEADSVCRLLGDKGTDILDEGSLAEMYSHTGRGAINPVLLCFVLMLQYLEKLPDRQTAKMVKVRLDWKYALRQEVGWAGFDYSSLCNFRKRLYAHG
ncbi:MAG: transposase, partial [Chloroflexi bacterium]|nr:transposase [Chloroflexota bacterium]